MFNLNGPQTPGDKNQMHPGDLRNMFIFFIVAVVLYFSYDFFILKPQAEALRKHRETQSAARVIDGEQNAQAGLQSAAPEVPVTRNEALSLSAQRLPFENDDVIGTINLKGARIDDLSLRHYLKKLDGKELVSVLEPRGQKFFRTVDYGWTSSDKTLVLPGVDTLWQVRGNERLTADSPVTLFWDNGQGLTFERVITLDEHFMFTIKDSVTNATQKSITLYPYGLIAQKGIPSDYQSTWVSHEGPIGYVGEALMQTGYSKLRKEKRQEATAERGWIGITDKYWLTTLIPPQGESVKYNYTFAGADVKDKENKGLYQADFRGRAHEVSPGGKIETTSHLFSGAKRVFMLEDYEKALNIPKFDLAVDFGWFWFMTKPFFFVLHYLSAWLGNLGAAIIILTIALRGAVFPLTNISYRSFAKMKKVTPQVADLRKKYPDDKAQLQKELIALYEREGVNPVAGCLPMVLQIPIFFALYKTFYVTIELRHAPFFGWIQDLSAPDPTSVFNLFGLIPWDPPAMLMIGVWPCLMLVAMLLQKNLNPPPQDPIQKDMAMYMPFLFAYMMSHFASGLVVYWTFSAFIGVIQQIIIMKSLNVPIHMFGETKEEKALDKAIDKGPAVHPLAEMIEDDVEEALFGAEGDSKAVSPAKPMSKPKPKKSKKKK
ncbi:MAG: membrane protein insertase YidC [Alphaproteobacteria bacterium]|nr:membrane protein insertase YidC [Alphaproteobacteria bacterium]